MLGQAWRRGREGETKGLSPVPLSARSLSPSLRFGWLNRNWLLLSVTYLKTKQTSDTPISIVAFYQARKAYLIGATYWSELCVLVIFFSFAVKSSRQKSRIEKASNLRLNSLVTKLKYCAEGLLDCEQAHLCEFGENFWRRSRYRARRMCQRKVSMHASHWFLATFDPC